MRLVFVLVSCVWMLVVPWCAGKSSSPNTGLDVVSLGGRRYVRLPDVAQLAKADWRWIKRDQTVELAAAGDRFRFSANSALSEVNGVNVWLSYPAVVYRGRLYLSELDWQKMLRPLLLTPKATAAKKIKVITLDPGHGGKDTGNRERGKSEKEYTLLLAQELGAQLRAAGYTVKMTRWSDKFVALEDRAVATHRGNTDLFLSLHFNATASSRDKVCGSEVYCLTPVGAASTNARGVGAGSAASDGNRHDSENILLAYHIQKALLRTLGTNDRGVRRARFQVLREVQVPAALIEAGFLSHPVEGRKIFDPAYRRQMAKAIVQGVVAYQKATGR